jgi:hypothetical protein
MFLDEIQGQYSRLLVVVPRNISPTNPTINVLLICFPVLLQFAAFYFWKEM